MRKCKNGHEMDHTGKHCGECGAVETAPAMHKCTTCKTEMVKSASSNFCTGCGTAVAPAEDLSQALDGVAAFMKARGQVEADLGELPEAPTVSPDDDEVGEILKSAAVRDAAGEIQGYRPDPIFTAVLAGQASTAADIRMLAAHQQKWNEHHAGGTAVLLKAVSAMGEELAAMKAERAAEGGRPRSGGRKTVVDVPEAARAAAAAGNADAGDDRLRGRALLTKCRQIGLEHPERQLSLEDIGALNQHANLNHSVVEILKSKRPELAARVAELIGEELPTKEELTVH